MAVVLRDDNIVENGPTFVEVTNAASEGTSMAGNECAAPVKGLPFRPEHLVFGRKGQQFANSVGQFVHLLLRPLVLGFEYERRGDAGTVCPTQVLDELSVTLHLL